METKKQLLAKFRIKHVKFLFDLDDKPVSMKRLSYLKKQSLYDLLNLVEINKTYQLLPVECLNNIKKYLH
mgnify:CR=1 FL=1